MKLDQPILVVDDDNAIRALLRTVLRKRGFRVETARNGLEALEKIGGTRYALVILDMMMPVMSGPDVLAWLAREAPLTRPPVLRLTAGFEGLGFDTTLVVGTMHKPFDIDLLLDAVVGFLTEAATHLPAVTSAVEPPGAGPSQPN